jgi:hypothetical protein
VVSVVYNLRLQRLRKEQHPLRPSQSLSPKMSLIGVPHSVSVDLKSIQSCGLPASILSKPHNTNGLGTTRMVYTKTSICPALSSAKNIDEESNSDVVDATNRGTTIWSKSFSIEFSYCPTTSLTLGTCNNASSG